MRSLNCASGSRTGETAKLAPSVAGTHLSIMIPFGTSTKAMRIGRAVSAASAGVMASSNGKAKTAPAPCRKARRGMAFLNITIAHLPHLKRRTLGDSQNDGRPTLIMGSGLAHDLANNRTIVLLDAAAQSIDEKPLGEGLNEQIPIAHQDLAQARW